MRMKLLGLASTVAILALLLPMVASAKRITVAGSLAFTRSDGSQLERELVVTTVMSNPGLERTVEQQLPLPAGDPAAMFRPLVADEC